MIGERLCDLRKDKALTQQELGKLLSLSKFTISSYENERTSPDDKTLISIAKIFNISLDYLMGLTDFPHPYQRETRALVLPPNFDEKQKDQVAEYIEFLHYQNSKRNTRHGK